MYILSSLLVYGVGYAWSPPRINVTEGDIVTWTWNVDQYVTGITYSVHQTTDEVATAYDGTGFTSGLPTKNGDYELLYLCEVHVHVCLRMSRSLLLMTEEDIGVNFIMFFMC